MKHTLLILSPGHQVYLVSLFEKYFNVIVADNNSLVISTYPNCKSILMPRYCDSTYKNRLLSIIYDFNVEYVLSLSDIEVVELSSLEPKLYELGCTIIGVNNAIAKICLDKYAFAGYAKEKGILSPKTFLNEEILLAVENESILYPLISKARLGMGSKGLSVIYNKEQLYQHIERERLEGVEYIYQEMVMGQEFGVDIVNNLEREYYGCCVKKKLEMKNGETNIAQIESSQAFERIARNLSSCIKHIGNIDCDLILSNDGLLYVIDINPRFGGGYIFSLQAGLNVPLLLSEWIDKGNAPAYQICNNGKKYRKLTTLMEIE